MRLTAAHCRSRHKKTLGYSWSQGKVKVSKYPVGESVLVRFSLGFSGIYRHSECSGERIGVVMSEEVETTRKLALNAENAIYEALALSSEPISKDTETWLRAAAMLVRRAIESIPQKAGQ